MRNDTCIDNGADTMRGTTSARQLLMLVGIACCLALVWWAVDRGADQSPRVAATTSRTPTHAASTAPGGPTSSPESSLAPTPFGGAGGPGGAGTPLSGLPAIRESRLPREGRATLRLIRAGGPYPYDDDDGIFQNRERILPRRAASYYREYTVETPGSSDRGARRIVGGAAGDRYYTDDHYDSFRQILEGQ